LVLSLEAVTADWVNLLKHTRQNAQTRNAMRLTLLHLIFRFRQV
jgi:hypothetical protein